MGRLQKHRTTAPAGATHPNRAREAAGDNHAEDSETYERAGGRGGEVDRGGRRGPEGAGGRHREDEFTPISLTPSTPPKRASCSCWSFAPA